VEAGTAADNASEADSVLAAATREAAGNSSASTEAQIVKRATAIVKAAMADNDKRRAGADTDVLFLAIKRDSLRECAR
jgi:hypothetical protein